MSPYKSAVFALLLLFAFGCKKEDTNPDLDIDIDLEATLDEASLGNGKQYFELPDSDDFSSIPQDPNNPLTAEKVKLGKLLFHETALAIAPKQDIGSGTYSCASCHFASAGFQAGRFQGIGEGGIGFGDNGEGRVRGSLYPRDSIDVQPIRTPSAMNGAWQKNQLWNGQFGGTGLNEGTESQWTAGTPKEKNNLGFEGLEIQAIAGLTVHRMALNDSILDGLGYRTYFDEVYADVAVSERYSTINAGLAIAAYERTVLANEAPFQKWLKGSSSAMSNEEKQGAILFFGKAKCNNCHTGPALNQMDFHAIGMKDLFEHREEVFQSGIDKGENKGRGGFTGNSEDNYKFKVPQLYNLADSKFYGHGSSMNSIYDVVKYKNNALAENPRVPEEQLSSEFTPLGLSVDEIKQITAFLERSLHDPNLSRYEPSTVLSGNCIPVNDPLSSNDLGCD